MMEFLKEDAHFKEIIKTDDYQDYTYTEGGITYYASDNLDTDSLKDMPVWFQELYWKADKEFEKKKQLLRLVNHEE